MDIKAVIFDMDGLMFDTEKIGAWAWNKIGNEMGYDFSEDFLSTVRGMNHEGLKAAFKKQYGESFDYDSIRNVCTGYYRQNLRDNGIPIKEGLFELLDFLSNNGYKVAVATGSTMEQAVYNLKSSGADKYFETIISGDMVKYAKPNPEIFELAAEKIGIIPEKCIVLEDSLNGIKAAVAGGFKAVMVPDLTEPNEELERTLTAKCKNLKEVIDILR
jgi:haloacid dehalogenase superfamily, subfamily IA, variant 3 with third motif having DD or ED/haloacid dehalogenase superfamily, subfamily IA, variant 1 with third motif having Dx(3-4)D or Dx(3-4)E